MKRRCLSVVLAWISVPGAYSWSDAAHPDWFQVGVEAARMGYWTKAANSFKLAVFEDPQSEKAYLNLAVAYTKLKKWSLAQGAYEKVIDINPQKQKAYIGLAYIYDEMGHWWEAVQFYEQALEADPTSPLIEEIRSRIFSLRERTSRPIPLPLPSWLLAGAVRSGWESNIERVPEELEEKEGYVHILEARVRKRFFRGRSYPTIVGYSLFHNLYPSRRSFDFTDHVFDAALSKRMSSQWTVTGGGEVGLSIEDGDTVFSGVRGSLGGHAKDIVGDRSSFEVAVEKTRYPQNPQADATAVELIGWITKWMTKKTSLSFGNDFIRNNATGRDFSYLQNTLNLFVRRDMTRSVFLLAGYAYRFRNYSHPDSFAGFKREDNRHKFALEPVWRVSDRASLSAAVTSLSNNSNMAGRDYQNITGLITVDYILFSK